MDAAAENTGGQQAPARVIAFYLPQYHPIPENDAWWSPGFTEWTNVAKARPLFRGHEQPHIPADLGFYDLRLPETRQAQADLARAHGVEGFCYWHYWFGGKRLLERPFTEVLRNGKPDFPFCLAWANESWTGIWHGAPGRILMEQTYPGEADYRAHFECLLEAFRDPRYIRVAGKPLFIVYKPRLLPDSPQVLDQWRNWAVEAGLPGLYVAGIDQDETWNPTAQGFDAVILSRALKVLLPQWKNRYAKSAVLWGIRKPWAWIRSRIGGKPSFVIPYEKAMRYFLYREPLDWDHYQTIVPNWDNTPRSGRNGVVLEGSTPELFERQVREAVALTAQYPPEKRLLFVKSWNEWAEGNYLEPDLQNGHAYLHALKRGVQADRSRE